MGRTTINIREETRERLKSYGRKGETYDNLLNKLLDRALPRSPPSPDESRRRVEEDYPEEYDSLEEYEKERGV